MGFGVNSILCVECDHLCHLRWSGLINMGGVQHFICPTCRRGKTAGVGKLERDSGGEWREGGGGIAVLIFGDTEEVEGRKPVGRPRKTWRKCIELDLNQLGLSEMAWDRREWGKVINRPTS